MYTYFKTKNGVAQNLIDDFFFLTFTVGNPSIGRASSEKNGGTRLLSEKTEALHAELNERTEAAISSYSAAVHFLQFSYSVLVANSH